MTSQSLFDALRLDSGMRGRFVEHAHNEDSNIKDFGDFSSALHKSFNTNRGKKASQFFDEKITIELFTSPENERLITRNISQKEFNDMIKSVGRTEAEVQRELPVGKVIKPKQVTALLIPKRLKVVKHTRKGKNIQPYNRGFMKWTPAQVRFLRVRKTKKITPRQIVSDYNKHFKDNQRSSSSIKTRVFRTT